MPEAVFKNNHNSQGTSARLVSRPKHPHDWILSRVIQELLLQDYPLRGDSQRLFSQLVSSSRSTVYTCLSP